MTGLLLDTHIWWWYMTGSSRLPKGLRSRIDSSSAECWLSPISVWELALLSRKGRVELRPDIRAWSERAMGALPLGEASLNNEVVLVSQQIDLGHRDPADHLIAATALVYELTLLTVDERLTKARWLPTRSR